MRVRCLGEVGEVGGALEDCAFGEAQVDLRLEKESAGDEDAAGDDRRCLRLWRRVDRWRPGWIWCLRWRSPATAPELVMRSSRVGEAKAFAASGPEGI